MPDRLLTALLLGDVVGQAGCRGLVLLLPGLIKQYDADLVVVNGENAADGYGITPDMVEKFYHAGVSVITSGNHVWQQKEILPLLEGEERLLRPYNYPKGVPGHGLCLVEVRGHKVGVVNLQGRVRMSNILCPFLGGKEVARKLKKDTNVILVDFHAEDPEEKEALGMYLDGEVSVVFGTHTHVQTADERILPKGTAYITDIGMIGPSNSVIGFKPQIALQRSLTQLPIKMEVDDGLALIQGIVVTLEESTGRARSIERIRVASTV
ncbi:MAG: TIGR00282 family metallophosphoesterase [Spirochaetales bacterium]